MAWYDENWAYRRPITIQSSQINSDLTDFPVYLRGSDFGASTFTNAKSAAEDFRITKADGTTELPFEIVYYNSGSNEFEIHFKADFMSSSSDTVFYLYYGNAAASAYAVTATYGRNAVWSNGFIFVNHLQSASGEDSAGNGGSATSVNSPTYATGKLAGNAVELNGSNQYMYHSDFPELAGMDNIGVSVWLKGDDYTVHQAIISQIGGASARAFWLQVYIGLGLNMYGASDLNHSNDSQIYEGSATSLLTENNWNHFIGWFDFSTGHTGDHSWYLDGTEITGLGGATAGSPTTTYNATANLEIGRLSSTYNRNFNGEIDEIRIFDAQRSDSWMIAEHTNQNTPATFYSVGSEETDGDVAAAEEADGKGLILIPHGITGDITHIGAKVGTDGIGTTGTIDVEIERERNGTTVAILSTILTIDANEAHSGTASTPAVINTSNDDVEEWDLLKLNLTGTPTGGTAPQGLTVYVVIS